MGGKPRKEPLTFDDLVQGYDLFNSPSGDIWKVTRYLPPTSPTKEFGMCFAGWEKTRIKRGVNKGGWRITLKLDYIDKEE